MKHIASVVTDGVAHYGIVDEETGELTQFAQILVPDYWDLESSALLGSNLVNVIGLNGTKHRRPAAPKALQGRAQPQPQPQLELDVPAPVPNETHSAPQSKRGQRPGRRTSRAYITSEMVVDVVNQHPEGVGLAAIAVQIASDMGVPYGEWLLKAVSNRCTAMQVSAKQGRTTLPYRSVSEPRLKADGKVSAQPRKVLYPLGPGR